MTRPGSQVRLAAATPGRELLALFLLCISVFVICAKGRPWVEADAQFARSRLLVATGRLGSDSPIADFDLRAANGRYYEVHGLLNILVQTPVAALDPLLSRLFHQRADDAGSFLASLSGAIINSLSVVAFYVLLRGLPIARGAALITAYCFGFGSMLFPYASSNYEGNADLLLLILGAHWYFSYVRTGRLSCLLWSGLFGGVAAFGRESNLALFGLIGLGLVVDALRTRNIRPVLWYLAGLAPCLLMFGWYNAIRTGTPLQTAISKRLMAGEYPFFEISGPYGVLCLLVSPGGSMFAFSPVLLPALAGLRAFVRRFKREALLSVSFAIICVVSAGLRQKWFGFFGWGPRYTMPALPFLLIPLAVWLDSPGARRPAARAIFGVVAGWALVVQLAGTLVDWHARLTYVLGRQDLSEFVHWSALMFTVTYSQWWDAVRVLVSSPSSVLPWWRRLPGESSHMIPVGLFLILAAATIVWSLRTLHSRSVRAFRA